MRVLHTRRPRRSRSFATRVGSIAGAVFAAMVAAVFFVAAYRVVFELRIGPTAVTVSESNGWGAHTGDALALPLAGVGALFVAVAVACVHQARQRPLLALVPRAAARSRRPLERASR